MVRCHRSKKGFNCTKSPDGMPIWRQPSGPLTGSRKSGEFQQAARDFLGTVVFNCCSTRRVGWRATWRSTHQSMCRLCKPCRAVKAISRWRWNVGYVADSGPSRGGPGSRGDIPRAALATFGPNTLVSFKVWTDEVSESCEPRFGP